MAHIRRHPVDKTKWQVRYIDPNGRERSKTFPRKVDADKFLIHVEAQKQRAEWINPELSATRFEEWAEGWLANRTHLKPKTFAGYESLIKVHILPRFGASRLDRIDSLSIEGWVADLKASGLSASRIRQAHNVLSQILKTAVRARYLAANSAEGVDLPRKPRREQLFLTPSEVDRLADVVEDRYRALIYVFAYGALRWGEAAASPTPTNRRVERQARRRREPVRGQRGDAFRAHQELPEPRRDSSQVPPRDAQSPSPHPFGSGSRCLGVHGEQWRPDEKLQLQLKYLEAGRSSGGFARRPSSA